MASQGPNGTGTGANDASFGDVAWTNPGNITLNDGSFATCAVGIAVPNTQYLKATNFSFTIPTGVTILGILIEPNAQISSGTATWNAKAVKGGTIQSTAVTGTANAITTSLAFSSLGSSTNLWGTTWTPADINSSTFGVVIYSNVSATRTFSVDYVRATVYYASTMTGVQSMTGVSTITL